MPLFEWEEKYRMGVVQLDRQHEHLMGLVNNIYDQFKQGAPVATLKALLEMLVEDANHHFECEERCMKETFYRGFAEHKKEHEIFRVRVGEIDKLFSEDMDISLDLMLFLNNWVRHHVLEVDARFADHICSSGNGPTAGTQPPFHVIIKKYLS